MESIILATLGLLACNALASLFIGTMLSCFISNKYKIFLNAEPKSPLIKFPINYIRRIEHTEECKVAYECYVKYEDGFVNTFTRWYFIFVPFILLCFIKRWVYSNTSHREYHLTDLVFDNRTYIDKMSVANLIKICISDYQNKYDQDEKAKRLAKEEQEHSDFLNSEFHYWTQNYTIER